MIQAMHTKHRARRFASKSSKKRPHSESEILAMIRSQIAIPVPSDIPDGTNNIDDIPEGVLYGEFNDPTAERHLETQTKEEKEIIEKIIEKLTAAKRYSDPIVTEVKKYDVFYQAEDYHQDYEKNNPNNPYIRAVSKPRVSAFLQNYPELIKSDLE